LIVGLVVVAAAVYVKARPVPENSSYVGSERCASCHAEIHAAWAASEHTRMMRPADRLGVVVADFDSEDEGLRFGREEAVWAIGGKWEQQFMGHDGKGETLLPGAWLNLAGHWDFKGWDGWEQPVPLRRCHGCHTVGLDVETGRFVEPNIGCESCHGPAEWHAQTLGLGRIHSEADAQICGQCHTRGTSASGEFFFPVGYRPGRDLDADFEHAGPSPGQNSSYWWGKGRVRKRHQEYAAWKQGGHADSSTSLRDGYDGRYGEVTEDCLRCHAGDQALGRAGPGVGDAAIGITCSVCHNVHGDLDEARVGCDACHEGGAFYHEPAWNDGHVACGTEARVDCTSCHMPQSVAIGGAYVLHDHGPGIVPPRDTLAWGTPSSCANGGCHADAEAAALQTLYEAHYGPGAPGRVGRAEATPGERASH
jgi:hypothetical protein